MPKSDYPPQKRKPTGLIGLTLSGVSQLVVWLFTALLLSVLIEWVGMVFWWSEQGSDHAQRVLKADEAYLNRHLVEDGNPIKQTINDYKNNLEHWAEQFANSYDTRRLNLNDKWEDTLTHQQKRFEQTLHNARPYWEAAQYVSQSFLIRLVVLIFSLPLFIVLSFVGLIDGLVERNLRRWGGGRESSNVFNLARRGIGPAFTSACVIYISYPESINPIYIVFPFAVLQGWAVRVAAFTLKKYF